MEKKLFDGQSFVVFDSEISDSILNKSELGQPHKLSLACLSLYDSVEDKVFSFTGSNLDSCVSFFTEADFLVSFNGLRFDLPLLAVHAFSPKEYVHTLSKPHIDMCLLLKRALGHWVSLDSCVRGSLGESKDFDSAEIPKLWRAGKRSEVLSHCSHHVDLTRRLFEFGLENRFIRFLINIVELCGMLELILMSFEAAVYDGNVPSVFAFVVDRVAIGYDFKVALDELNDLFKLDFSEEKFMTLWGEEFEDAVDNRKAELALEVKQNSISLVNRLNNLARQAEDILANTSNPKAFNQAAMPLLRSLELIGKAIGSLRDAPKVQINSLKVQQNLFSDLKSFQEMGLLEFKDEEKLKNLLEVSEQK